VTSRASWLEYWVDPATWTFRGDFEGMYRDFADPWECVKNVSELRRDVALLLLLRERRFRRILDVGCGLGAFTERLRRANTATQEVLGVDISATAVAKARAQYPDCRFEVLDVARQPLPAGPWELVLLSEVVWYVLPQLGELLARIHLAMASDGVLFVQQFFPDSQRFGLEYLRSPEELYTRYLTRAGFRRQCEFVETVPDGRVQLISVTKSDSEG
jgi:predicted TPR repeat methyltransferase